MINNRPYGVPLAALFIGGVLPAVLDPLIKERSWLYEIKAASKRERASQRASGWARPVTRISSCQEKKTIDLFNYGII